MTPSEREALAADLLFRDALATCDRAAVRRFGAKFGALTSTKADTVYTASRTVRANPVQQSESLPPQKQSTLFSYLKSPFLQTQLLKAIEQPLKRKEVTSPVEEKSPAAQAQTQTQAPKRKKKETVPSKKTVPMEV